MRHAVILLIVTLGSSAPATARGTPKEPAVVQEAREHYEKGLSHYNLGEFSDAIDEFKRAYEISKAPRLLFNLAQAQRLNKDYEQALYSYTTYLRLVPDAPNRVDVAARIAEMSRLLKEDRDKGAPEPAPQTTAPPAPVEPAPAPTVAPPAPAPTTAPPAPVVTAPPPPPPPPSRAMLYAGIGVAAGGVALLAAAAGLTGAAASAGSDLSALKSSHGMWDAHFQSLYDDGQRYQAAAAALWAVGGAATVAGAVVAVVGARRARHLAVAALPGAASITWSGSW